MPHNDRLHTGATSDKYRDNYDAIFKKKDKQKIAANTKTAQEKATTSQ